jgi:3-hydroxyacyl-[acyl-carrier-protein] dehydratase
MGFGTERIKEIIPHREPMLFVDEVTDIEPGVSIEAKFYVRPEWDIFRGHFPGAPVLPGVISVEALAQAADILLLSADRYAGKIPYFIGLDEVKFKRKVSPGDTITMKAKVWKENAEKAVVTCEAEAYVNGELATSGKLALAMR